MQILLYVALGLLLTWALIYVYFYLASKAIEGRPTDDLVERLPALAQHPRGCLIYCYSPACGPCRSMSPRIDELIAEGAPIVKLDIAEQRDIALDLGVRGAPTLLLVADGTVKKVILGAQSKQRVQALLDESA